MLLTLLNGLMVIGARGGVKLTEVISKQKHSFAWNGDNIINKVNLAITTKMAQTHTVFSPEHESYYGL